MTRIGSTIIIFSFFIVAGCNNNPEPKATIPEVAPQAVNNGEQLFKVKCMQCHMPAKDFAAPALAGVANRWENRNMLYDYVRNPKEVIEKNDYAAALFEKWNQAPMLPFPDLSNDDIEAILKYCDEYAAKQ